MIWLQTIVPLTTGASVELLRCSGSRTATERPITHRFGAVRSAEEVSHHGAVPGRSRRLAQLCRPQGPSWGIVNQRFAQPNAVECRSNRVDAVALKPSLTLPGCFDVGEAEKRFCSDR